MAKARDLIVAHHSGYATESPEVEPSGVHLPAPPAPVPAPLRARSSGADVAAYVLAVLGSGAVLTIGPRHDIQVQASVAAMRSKEGSPSVQR